VANQFQKLRRQKEKEKREAEWKENLDKIMSMGYDRKLAKKALEIAGNDVNRAVTWIIEREPGEDDEKLENEDNKEKEKTGESTKDSSKEKQGKSESCYISI
jgi:uncharacterized UBP type Zn finger protein